ncbi:MAG: hypothetical protein KF859_04455 [Phycisphaeraceae bacterium]|nr:hypothetical protein [Phycisphaeraceae bacterium]
MILSPRHDCECALGIHTEVSQQIRKRHAVPSPTEWGIWFPTTRSSCVPGVLAMILEYGPSAKAFRSVLIRLPKRVHDDRIEYVERFVDARSVEPVSQPTVTAAEESLVLAMLGRLQEVNFFPFSPWREVSDCFQSIELHVAGFDGEPWRKIIVECDRFNEGFEANLCVPFSSSEVLAHAECPIGALNQLSLKILGLIDADPIEFSS